MNEVRRLWVRSARRAPVSEEESLLLQAGEGVVGDHRFGSARHVTIVFEEDWAAALADLGREVDPSARRANVLVGGSGGATHVGTRIRLGEAEIVVAGIVEPCSRMDEAAEGLRAALEPDGRAGIWGRVVASGRVKVGDELRPS